MSRWATQHSSDQTAATPSPHMCSRPPVCWPQLLLEPLLERVHVLCVLQAKPEVVSKTSHRLWHGTLNKVSMTCAGWSGKQAVGGMPAAVP
jgi:hypothetical protein